MTKAWEMKPERTYIETTNRYNEGVLFRIDKMLILKSEDDGETWNRACLKDEEFFGYEFKAKEYMTVRRLIDEMADRAFEENRLNSVLEDFPSFFVDGVKEKKDTVKGMYKDFLLPNVIESLGEEGQIIEDEMGRTFILIGMNMLTNVVNMMRLYDESEVLVSFKDILDMKITHQAVRDNDK